MNVKGKYKYYVKYDGWNHCLLMEVKYKVNDTEKVYKTNFNITEFINIFDPILLEWSKHRFNRTNRIYADYILSCGVTDMLRFIICRDIEKRHIISTAKKKDIEVNKFIKNLTRQKWCEFTLPIVDGEECSKDIKTEIYNKMFNGMKKYQNSQKIKFRED